MKSQYNDILEKIIKKYEYKLKTFTDSNEIKAVLVELFCTSCTNKKVAIWGVGKNNSVNSHAAVIISRYILELKGLMCLIDSDKDLQGIQFMGYPIIAPEQIREKGADLVIIASRASGASIKADLMNYAPECDYIDIYEELGKKGIDIDYNFFSEKNVYTRLFRIKEGYMSEKTKGVKEKALHDLIATYLEIRDFSYAFEYAEEYCRNQYENYEQLMEMMDEIRVLIKEIKAINQCRKEDVIIHLIDSLRAIDVYGKENENKAFQMFLKYEKYSSKFTEAYSTGPTTYESMIGMIKQKLSYEENVYEDSNFLFDFEEFSLLEDMKERNMSIHFYVAKDYMIMKEDSRIERKEQLHMSEKLWNVACDIAESKNPTFNFIYYPWEMHFPLLCGFHQNHPKTMYFSDVGIEDMSDYVERQFDDCKRYVERQFSFYKEFFSDEMITVFIGDHSQPVYDKEEQKPFFMYYKEPDRVSHVAFFIHSKTLESHNYSQLISMLDFNAILKSAITEHQICIPEREIIQYQYYNMQNKKLREAAKAEGYMDYTEGISCFISKDFLYAKTATGIDEVYRRKEPEENIIETLEGQQFKEKVEKKFDTEFPKFWTIRKEV